METKVLNTRRDSKTEEVERMTYDKEKAIRNFRKFNSFFENNIQVHFKLETGEFRNGKIIDLNLEKLTLVFKEEKFGTIPILLEDIKESSITERRIE